MSMGYARFRERCADTFLSYREQLVKEIGDPRVNDRLRDAQHLLCDLVETLDSRRVRYLGTSIGREDRLSGSRVCDR